MTNYSISKLLKKVDKFTGEDIDFNKGLYEGNPIELEVLNYINQFNDTIDSQWERASSYLKTHYPKIGIQRVELYGNKLSRCRLFQIRFLDTKYEIYYKGIKFIALCNKDEICTIHAMCVVRYGRISTTDDIETAYKEAIEQLLKYKRETMTYYNKKNKELKQEYHKELDAYNKLLKGDK